MGPDDVGEDVGDQQTSARGAGRAAPKASASERFLVLIYRIPSEPTRLRAGVWRKIKGLGAVYVQNSAAALPETPANERALRALRAEIDDLGGSAFLFDGALLAGREHLVDLFNSQRDDEYEEVVDRCDDFLQQIHKEYAEAHFTYAELEENDVDLQKLTGWLARIRDRDAFDAAGYAGASEALARCETSLEEYAARVYEEEGEGPRPT